MKVYRIDTHDNESGMCHFWVRTKRQAEAALIELDAIDQPAEYRMVNIPLDKRGLLKFLNDCAVTQDGYGDVHFPDAVLGACK